MSQYFITRQAALDLQNIYNYSLTTWGEDVAEKYLENIILELQKIANAPESKRRLQHRKTPFLMAPVGKHYAIYKPVSEGAIIVTLLHGRRDIEAILKTLEPQLSREISEIQENI